MNHIQTSTYPSAGKLIMGWKGAFRSIENTMIEFYPNFQELILLYIKGWV